MDLEITLYKMASRQRKAYCMAGFGVLITSVIFITIVTGAGDTVQLVALVGLAALTRLLIRQTEICTHVAGKPPGSVDSDLEID